MYTVLYTVFSIGSPTSASPETAFTLASPLDPLPTNTSVVAVQKA